MAEELESWSVFTYGTLIFEELMEAVTGARFRSEPARLPDHERFRLAGASYPGLVPHLGAHTEGRLYHGLDRSALARLDRFEGELYDRVEVEVATREGPSRARVYLLSPRGRGLRTDEPWDPEAFRTRHLSRALASLRRASTSEGILTEPEPQRISVDSEIGEVSALLLRPANATHLLLFAHGAGADMHHEGMERPALALAERGVASLRFQFPYTERGSRRPDRAPKCIATIHAANRFAAEHVPGLPRVAGGRSMGGRMSSLAAAEAPLEGVAGLVFFAFPLHPAGKPGTSRADHLAATRLPLLFLQGTRDKLAGLDLLEPVIDALGTRASLHVVPDADHGFHVPKRSGRTDDEVRAALADRVRAWLDALED